MKVKTPKEDPAIKSAREREERRADQAFVENAQGVLDDETRKKIRRFGARGRVARVAGTGAGGGTGTGTGSGGGSYDPGSGGSSVGGGFGGGGFGGSQQRDVSLS